MTKGGGVFIEGGHIAAYDTGKSNMVKDRGSYIVHDKAGGSPGGGESIPHRIDRRSDMCVWGTIHHSSGHCSPPHNPTRKLRCVDVFFFFP